MGAKLWKRIVRMACVAAMLVTCVPISVQPAFAAGDYTGGADLNPPVYIVNDHTVYAVHVTGSGLPVSKALNVSVKLSNTGVAGGFTNAPGFTWNATAGRWVQSREAATSNGTLTSDASGNVSGWVYFKCGNENFTGFAAGSGHGDNQAYLTVQIQDGVGSSYNPTVKPIVTVLNAATQAAWVHNGVSTGASAGDRADALSTDGLTYYGVHKVEANSTDDNDDAVVDNEDYGPSGATGDFLLSVPSATALNVNLAGSAWAPGQGATAGAADTNIAVGATDQTPPSAPSGLVATPHDNSVSLSWTASTDSGGSGLSGYDIYRSTGTTYPVQGTGNSSLTSALRVRIGSVSAGTTTYTDSAAVNGTTYYYFVRAVDGDTNASARSNVQSAIPAQPETTPPTTAISGVSDGGNYTSPAQFSLEASDNVGGSGVAATYYTVDSVQSTYTVPVSITASGTHTVTYWSVDNNGNEEGHHSVTFNVSSGAPVTTISGVVAGWSKVAETFSLVATGDGGTITSYYKLNSGETSTYAAPVIVSAQGTTTVSYWSADSLNQTETPKMATIRIDGYAPVTSISGLVEGGTYGNSVTFTLSAADGASGVQQVNYLIDNPGGTGALHPSGPVTLSGLSAGTHTVTYWSKDNANNTEGRNTLTFQVAPTRYEQTDAKIRYDGAFSTATGPLYSGGTCLYTYNAGRVATVTFNGTAIDWIGVVSKSSGIASVSVDGGAAVPVDLYSAKTTYGKVWGVSGLPNTTHVVTITTTGSHSASSTGSMVAFDAFDVLGTLVEPPTTTRHEQTDTKIRYTGTLSTATGSLYSGGTSLYTYSAGRVATVTFSGTAIAWIGVASKSSGIASVSVDGGAAVPVDLYSAKTTYGKVWGVSGLPDTTHVVTITTTGSHGASSTGNMVAFDAFEVLGTLEQTP